jgi:hypothetical protein
MLTRIIEACSLTVWRLFSGTLRAIWALIRPGLKVLSFVLLLTAIIALTSDVTRWQTGAEGPLFQSLAAIMTQTAPASFQAIADAIALRIHPVVWDPLLLSLLNLPAWIILLAAAIGFAFAARERKAVNIFVN